MECHIPGVPNSTVKRSHDVNVQNLIQKIENHPQRQALQNDLQQHRQFNLFSKESQEVITAAGNIELCELLDMYGTQSTVQSMFVVLKRRHCLQNVRTLFARWDGREQEIPQVHSLTSFRFPITTSRKGDSTATATGRKKLITSTSSRIRSRRNA